MSLTEAIFARPSYSQMERLIAAEEVKNRIMSTYVGTPLVTSTAAGMTDTDRIYVYVGSETGYTSGNWYYYDGSAWTSGGVYNSTAFETDDTLTIPDAAADAKAVGDELSDLKNALTTKAEQDGAYPDLTVGQLLSKNEASDSVPYNFRAVGHEATLEYTDAIVGGTIVNNQFCDDPTFTDESKWYPSSTMAVTISNNVAECIASGKYANLRSLGIRSAGTLNGHVVGVLCDLKADEAYNINIAFGDNNLFTDTRNKAINTSWTTYGMLAKHAEVKMASVYAGIRDDHENDWKKIYVKNFMVFDLTAMFGTAIADYVYGLETATTGSGVAWLKQHFPNIFDVGYIAYNTGEIVSVQGLSQHVTVGFNQWDEEWEVGGISGDDGQNLPNTDRIRSKNYIPIIPNETYYFCYTGTVSDPQLYVCAYDGNKNFIARTTSAWNVTRAFVDNVRYVRFFIYHTNGITVYNHDICINLSSSKNGTYEPYQKRTYPLDDSLTLRGIPKLTDSNGSGDVLSIIDTIHLYYDGDRYLPDGTVQRRYGVVDLGTLSYSFNDTRNIFSAPLPFAPSNVLGGRNNAMCEKYTLAKNNISYTDFITMDKVFKYSLSGFSEDVRVIIRDTSYTDADTFKAAMSGVMLLYELATPTSETADPYTVPQIVDPDGTEEYVSTSVVPVGHESRYPLDIAGRLDKILTMPTANGTYTLRATVNNGAVTYAWVST